MCFREDEWPRCLTRRLPAQCTSSSQFSSPFFLSLQATSSLTSSPSPGEIRKIILESLTLFAPRSEEDYEDEGRYLPGENELSCSCANLLLSSLGQAAGVQPQSMGIYERWQKKITQEQIRVPSGGKARNTVNDQSTVVLLQVFSISLNNQLTLVGW